MYACSFLRIQHLQNQKVHYHPILEQNLGIRSLVIYLETLIILDIV